MLIPKFEVSGQRAISRAMKRLGPKLAKKPIRKGARAGAKVLAAEVRRRAPKRTGNLRKQVKVRAGKRSRNRIEVLASTGDPRSANLNSGDGFYGGMVNYGRGPGGWHRGRIDGSHFIEESFDDKKEKAEQVAAETIADETNKELKKL